MTERTEDQRWLIDVMERYGMNRPEIARMAEASLGLVKGWLAIPGSAAYRPMRSVYRGMLEMRLAKRKPVVKTDY